MNIWLPPYRIGVLKNDIIAVQAVTKALENNKNWEIIYTDTFWESGFLAVNCGLHAIFLNDSLQESDLTLELFDQARFFACRKLPIPFLLMKTSSNNSEPESFQYPLSRKIKSAGIINHLKNELFRIEKEISSKSTTFSTYTEFQFLSFIKGKFENPGGILLNAFPNHYLIHGCVWGYLMEKKYTEAESFLKKMLLEQPSNPFFQATEAIFYYHIHKFELAREKLNPLLNENNSNPFLLYLTFHVIDQFNDPHGQFFVLNILLEKFPNSYITRLASALWNCRMDQIDLATVQLLGCFEEMPQDIVVASELLKIFQKKKYSGLFSGVKNYSASFFLKSNLTQYMFTNLLGIKN